MLNLAKKVAVGLTTGGLIAQSMFALPAFAAIEVQITGNGANSANTSNVAQTTNTIVTQTNNANITNNVGASANSGSNQADDNTGGNVKVDTGNAQAAVQIENVANHNDAVVDCGGCLGNVKAAITGNGANSLNGVNLDLNTQTFVTQANDAAMQNNVGVSGNSGNNSANQNTGGTVEIKTGKASAGAAIDNKANSNVAVVGNGSNGNAALQLIENGNGANSTNTIDATLLSNVVLAQVNAADIVNSVGADANSGRNQAADNTGGSSIFTGVSIDTGDAITGVSVDNEANFNAAHIGDCCQFDGLIKTADNGAFSSSTVGLVLNPLLAATQDNAFLCDQGGCNNIGGSSDSGANAVNQNTAATHGDPSVDTGNASSAVDVANTTNANVFSTGDAIPGSTNWWNVGSTSSNSSWWWQVFSGMGSWSN